jgi:hypothetical protein
MPDHVSLLDELRLQYEAARTSPHTHEDVPGFQEIDGHLRKAYRWLERAIAYLDGIHPPIEHRFDLGHGLAFANTRFERGFVGQHEQRIVGFPVLDEININYQIVAAAPPPVEVAPEGVAAVERVLDDAGLQYTARRVEDHGGTVRKCVITIPPAIPAAIAFRVDYQTAKVRIDLLNVDRFDRVNLEFSSRSIAEPVLEDLVRLILGRSDAFLRHASLVGIHGKPS